MPKTDVAGPRPVWLKVRIRADENFDRVHRMMADLSLHTVCQEARCPNIFECWGEGTATFMILGDVCTRHCGFCAVSKGRPRPLDPLEPRNVGEAVRRLGLNHAVVTSVNRDELSDGGAAHFAETVRWIRLLNPGCRVEVLIPDFCGNDQALEAVLAARPDVLNHNTETVPRLYKRVRPDASYKQSLRVLERANSYKSQWPLLTKSGLMVGLGETCDELLATFRDIRETGCEILTVGQYLSPTPRHLPIQRYYTPEEFANLREHALSIGFKYVEAGPLVRSSYHAGRHTSAAQPRREPADLSDPVFAEWATKRAATHLVQLQPVDRS